MLENILAKATFLSASQQTLLAQKFSSLPKVNQKLIFVFTEHYSQTQEQYKKALQEVQKVKEKLSAYVRKTLEESEGNQADIFLEKMFSDDQGKNLAYMQNSFSGSWKEHRLCFYIPVEGKKLVEDVDKREVNTDPNMDVSEALGREIDKLGKFHDDLFEPFNKLGGNKEVQLKREELQFRTRTEMDQVMQRIRSSLPERVRPQEYAGIVEELSKLEDSISEKVVGQYLQLFQVSLDVWKRSPQQWEQNKYSYVPLDFSLLNDVMDVAQGRSQGDVYGFLTAQSDYVRAKAKKLKSNPSAFSSYVKSIPDDSIHNDWHLDEFLQWAPDHQTRREVVRLARSFIERNEYAFNILITSGTFERDLTLQEQRAFVEAMLSKESTHYEHISFLTNVLPTVVSESQLLDYARNQFYSESASPIQREKGALLLVAFGEGVQSFSQNDLAFIAQVLHQTKRFPSDLSPFVENTLCFEKAQSKHLPLASYFSLLDTVKSQVSATDFIGQFTLFENLVTQREQIQGQKLMRGDSFVAIEHNNTDTKVPRFYKDGENTFSSLPFQEIAKKSGIPETKRYVIQPERGESAKQTLARFESTLELAQSPSLYLGGHGFSSNEPSYKQHTIQFNNGDYLKMSDIFSAIAQSSGNVYELLLNSCYSDKNTSVALPNLGEQSPLILSSNNNSMKTNRASSDAWHYFAFHGVQKTPTWGDYWKNLEGRLMVLGTSYSNADPVLFKAERSKYEKLG